MEPLVSQRERSGQGSAGEPGQRLSVGRVHLCKLTVRPTVSLYTRLGSQEADFPGDFNL